MIGEKIYKILIIDKDEFIRNYVRDVFWIHGRGHYEVFIANDLTEAKNIIKENKPDIILLDLMMPETKVGRLSVDNSLGFLKDIKSSPVMRDIKVIVYSGYEELKDEVMKLGAEGFLAKGAHLPKELINEVENLLKSRK